MKDEDEYQDYDEHEGCAVAASVILTWAVIMTALIILFCSSCTNTKYVPMESVRTEYVNADTTAIFNRLRSYFEARIQKETSRDSLIDRERETVVLKENGDTARHDRERIVYVSSHREKELEHELSRRDSVIDNLRTQLASVKSDSIPMPYPVERELSRWEQAKMDFGGMALGAVVVAICVAVVWCVRRFKVK